MLDFPDVSNNNGPFDLTPYPAAIAKATEGATFTDTFYAGHQAQAAGQGKPFMAYHWVDSDDLQAQASHAFAVVGSGVPLMLDAEALGADVGHLTQFAAAYRGLGGQVTCAYFPRWWWHELGEPSLIPLAASGLSIISSDYDIHGGPSPLQWIPYGGITPTINQYTSRGPGLVDSNRFNGTVEQLRAVFEGDTMTPEQAQQLDDVASVLDALFNLEDPIRLGQYAGKPSPIVQAIKDLQTRLTALENAEKPTGGTFSLIPLPPVA